MKHEIRPHHLQLSFPSTIGYKRTLEVADREERLQNAILAYNN
jgi:hypothetical protein